MRHRKCLVVKCREEHYWSHQFKLKAIFIKLSSVQIGFAASWDDLHIFKVNLCIKKNLNGRKNISNTGWTSYQEEAVFVILADLPERNN